MHRLLSAVLSTAVALSSIGTVAAQTGPTGPQPGPGGPQTGPGTPAAPVVGISEADLLNFLRTLDPNVRGNKSPDGKATIYELKIQRNGWNFDLVVISRDGTIEVVAPLGSPIANVQSIPSPMLAELLALNWNVTPAQFSFIKQKDGRMLLVFSVALPRGTMTTAGLGNLIDAVCQVLQKTYPAWSAVTNAAR
jgi:hypothetical protein